MSKLVPIIMDDSKFMTAVITNIRKHMLEDEKTGIILKGIRFPKTLKDFADHVILADYDVAGIKTVAMFTWNYEKQDVDVDYISINDLGQGYHRLRHLYPDIKQKEAAEILGYTQGYISKQAKKYIEERRKMHKMGIDVYLKAKDKKEESK